MSTVLFVIFLLFWVVVGFVELFQFLAHLPDTTSAILYLLFWIFAVLSGVFAFILLSSLTHSKRKDFLFTILCGIIALVLGFASVLIRHTEPVQWYLSKDRDKIESYETYIRKFPEGKHIIEAKTRLASLPRENALLRRSKLNNLITEGRGNNLGASILHFFVNEQPDGPFSFDFMLIRKTEWPSDYSKFTWFINDNPFNEFAQAIRSNANLISDSKPPFRKLTVVIEYWGRNYALYNVEGSHWGSVPGLSIGAHLLVYKPDEQRPYREVFVDETYPDKKITFRKPGGEFVTSSSEMRQIIYDNVFGNMKTRLRRELF